MKTAGLRPRLRNDISSGNSQKGTSASAYHSQKNPKKQHGLHLPYSKQKLYVTSRISKKDLYFFEQSSLGRESWIDVFDRCGKPYILASGNKSQNCSLKLNPVPIFLSVER